MINNRNFVWRMKCQIGVVVGRFVVCRTGEVEWICSVLYSGSVPWSCCVFSLPKDRDDKDDDDDGTMADIPPVNKALAHPYLLIGKTVGRRNVWVVTRQIAMTPMTMSNARRFPSNDIYRCVTDSPYLRSITTISPALSCSDSSNLLLSGPVPCYEHVALLMT